MRMPGALLRGVLILVILAVSILPARTAIASPQQQAVDPQQQARDLLAKMTPEERVGQLFLITFDGREIEQGSPIFDLIANYSIGGVMLRSDNDNFTGPDNTIQEAYALTSRLQTIAWESVQQALPDTGAPETVVLPQYVPLFIGISQEGDGSPYDQILNGMTPLPNLMAIGATWKPEMAENVGRVLGQELQALGFNLVLGPSLDVLDVLHTEGGEDLGTRTFGGDPFWVGEMGKSYIQGLHEGGSSRLAVIAKHFPGRGGSDRPPDEEVATVRKSLEQLKQIELAPFFDVTGYAPTAAATTDGLLLSHIRYQGFQGNIRATTRPVSFDPAALEQLMGLDPFASWRSNGGVVVSDDLGSQAVRRFYSPTDQSFEARQVARNAFLAGNDLLYMDNFIATGDPDTYTTILRTLEFFAQKYREDPVFAQKVDVSVERLLALKFRMYPEFSLENVLPAESGLEVVGQSEAVTFEVAQNAATLISPDPSELATTLSGPPASSDQIVFLTDAIDTRQCTHCASQPVFPVDALQSAVVRLYGPQSGAQVLQYQLTSYSFTNLIDLLNGASVVDNDIKLMDEDLRSADWVVLTMLNVSQERSGSSAIRRLLSERPDLIRNKRVIVFAFNAPYYLDATDITKLTAYYGLYSKAPAFVDLAARLLFQEAVATGRIPVSVPGIGYDLISATSPDPSQVIPLSVDLYETAEPAVTPTSGTVTVEPTPVPTFKVGDVLPLRAGIIYDHNRNIVPDGTVVRFNFTQGGEGGTVQQVETVTEMGVARTSFRIQSPGLLEISVASDPATTSELLRLDISAEAGAAITQIAPTLSATPTITPQPTETITPLPPTPTPQPPPPGPSAGPGEWAISMLLILGAAAGVFWIGRQLYSIRWGVRWALLVSVGGLLAYVLYFVIVSPDSERWASQGGISGLSVSVLGGVVLGWVGGWLWQFEMERRARLRPPRQVNSPE